MTDLYNIFLVLCFKKKKLFQVMQGLQKRNPFYILVDVDIDEFSSSRFSNINLIIGENGAGKTFLLKALIDTSVHLYEQEIEEATARDKHLIL